MLGQGTWGMGEQPGRRAAEVAALRLGLDLGLTLIDTAEMYGEGGAEEVVAEAIGGAARRGLPGQQGLSAQRLGQGHGRRLRAQPAAAAAPTASTSICCTGAGRTRWRRRWRRSSGCASAGKIRHWGVSNFDTDEMEELAAVPGGARLRQQPGALQPRRAAASNGTCCPGAASAASP